MEQWGILCHRGWLRRCCGMAALLFLLAALPLPPMRFAHAEEESFCGQEEHSHAEDCYTTVCICTVLEAEQRTSCGMEEHAHTETCLTDAACTKTEHQHTDACLDTTAEEPHVHQEACYQTELICTKVEHTHTDLCFSDTSADIEQPSDWEATLPSLDDSLSETERLAAIAESQLGYRESTQNYRVDDANCRCGYTRYGAWYGDPYGTWNGMFAAFCLFYAGISSETVPHCADVLQMMEQASVQLPSDTEQPKRGMLIFWQDADGVLSVGIVADVQDGQLTAVFGDLDDAVAPVVFSVDDAAICGYVDPQNNANVPETVEPEPLQSEAVPVLVAAKAEKDNSAQLSTVRCADTREFITLNLYNYGNNINDKYRSDRKYPGFQQEYGALTATKIHHSNFGNNITADLSGGISGLTNGASGINKVTDSANSPISKLEQVMYPTLKDGYPALKDGTSLGYLFGADQTYGKRQNDKNISGLFQYNETTGAYTYNSRENHAQFDPKTDTFTVYRQMLTPNMTMYPFGNFLPFNDIVHDAAQAASIDRAYLASVAASAQEKQAAGASVYNGEYGILHTALTDWIACMDAAYPSGWAAADAIDAYFNTLVGSGFDFSKKTDLLEKLYCLDYDVPTDFYFGMEMSMSFLQPRNGLTGADGKQPMRFYFTGDDDVWVYVDDVLFLDLSGIHRHVGGEIDFQTGTVRYYSLDPATGDVSSTPWREVRFSEILGDKAELNAAGTFASYSVHDLHFYYMERGSGSGVCRLNFNMPLLLENSVSIQKELSVDGGDASLLGDPDFLFQVLKPDETPFFSEGRSYTVTDAAGKTIAEKTVEADGILRIKAGQTAVFTGVPENAGQYFVRELLSDDSFSQYGSVQVDGSAVTSDHYTKETVSSEQFYGVNSTVKDAADGASVFRFENRVTVDRLGAIEIEKVLQAYTAARTASMFSFRVLFDEDPVPIGTVYTVFSADGSVTSRTVEEAGTVTIAAGETARIENILSGTRFIVEEQNAKSNGYLVQYTVDGGNAVDGYAAGTVGTDTTSRIVVKNTERGTTIHIPVEKHLAVADGTESVFSLRLEQLADGQGDALLQDGTVQTLSLRAGDTAEFVLSYAEPMLGSLPVKRFYRIYEEIPTEASDYRYDTTVYRVEITVDRSADDVLTAAVSGLWKDAVPIDTVSVLRFENTRLTSLSVEKTVTGDLASTERKFQFQLALTWNGSPWQGTAIVQQNDFLQPVSFDEKGTTTFALGSGEVLTFAELPYGAAWTLTELDADTYSVTMQTGDAEPNESKTANGVLDSINGTVVRVVNEIKPPPPLVQTGERTALVWGMAAGGTLLTGIGAGLFLWKRRTRL